MRLFSVVLLIVALAGCSSNFDPGEPSLLGVLAPGGVCGVYPPGSSAWQTCMAVGPTSGPGASQPWPSIPSLVGAPPAAMGPSTFASPTMPDVPAPTMPSVIHCQTTSSQTSSSNGNSSTTTTQSTCHG